MSDLQPHQQSAIKVYYHLDDSTPYMSEVQAPFEGLTLGDFKRVFNRRGYSYFCKEWDPILKREVKVEITNDRKLLHKSANGLIELFLLSQQKLAVPQKILDATLPVKTSGISGHKLPKRCGLLRSTLSSTELDVRELVEEGVSCARHVSLATEGTEEASSDLNTLISKRAGENLAELYNSTSEEPYNRTSISSSAIFQRKPLPGAPVPSAESTAGESGILDRTLLNNSSAQQKRQQRKQQRYRKPYVPSTISSESESTYSLPRIEEVKLRLQDAPLGIAVASQFGSIFIYHIQSGSASDKCGRLEVGDQIVQIDDTRFEDLNEKQALDLLKRLSTSKKTITMYVAKRARTNGGESSDKSDPLSLLCETQQLDISQWVESTTNKNCVEQFRPFADVPPSESRTEMGGEQQASCSNSKPHFPAHAKELKRAHKHPQSLIETSDEERAAYLDRRNGMGARLVPAIQQVRLHQQEKVLDEKRRQAATHLADLNNPIVLGGTEPSPSSNPSKVPAALPPRAQQPLHAAMDPRVILSRMVGLDSGLTIRDRKWLKIPVPMSFIGEEMIDWLLENVQGFRDRRVARAFASKLLARGLIKHVVNISSFNEKCYYIFDDEIIADRLRTEEQRRQQQQQHELSSSFSGNSSTQPPTANEKRPSAKAMVLASTTAAARPVPESNTEITYMSNPVTTTTATAISPVAVSASIISAPPHHHQQSDLLKQQVVVANNLRYVPGPKIVLNYLATQGNSKSAAIQQRSADPSQLNKINNNINTHNSNNADNTSIPLRTLNPPSHVFKLPIWPVSPILSRNRLSQRSQLEATEQHLQKASNCSDINDYASMIQGEINCGAQFDVHFDGLLSAKATKNPSPQKNPNFSNELFTTNNNIPKQNINGTTNALKHFDFPTSNNNISLPVPPPSLPLPRQQFPTKSSTTKTTTSVKGGTCSIDSGKKH